MDEAIVEPPRARGRVLHPAAIVWLLGLSQIIGYGTLYYSFAILAESAADSFAWPPSWLYGGLSIGLFAGGLIAPTVGRRIDRHGAASIMTVGSAGAALSLLAAALAPNGIAFTLAVVGTQIAGALVLYDAAFAALVRATGPEARLRITHLTLIAGFASTLFWPLTVWLHGMLDWRQVLMTFALANLLVCVPIHALLAREHVRNQPTPATALPGIGHEPIPQRLQRRALWLMTIGFALCGLALSAMLAQMVPMLAQLGLGTSALVVSTLFGPAQVLVRFVNMLVGVHRHPITATLFALALVPAAIAVLALAAPWAAGAVLFAVLLGFASGLKSIVAGTLPLALFGSASYGERLGHMAAVRQILASIAPFTLAFLSEAFGNIHALWVMVAIGGIALLCLIEVARLARRK